MQDRIDAVQELQAETDERAVRELVANLQALAGAGLTRLGADPDGQIRAEVTG
jgi:hypothetical protein